MKYKNQLIKYILFLLFLPIIGNPLIILNIVKRIYIFVTYPILGYENLTILNFGINYSEVSIDSLVLIQKTWWILFFLLNSTLILLISEKTFFSFSDFKNIHVWEEIKKNKIYSLFLFLIIILAFYEVFCPIRKVGNFSNVCFSCFDLAWDIELKSKLDGLSLIRKWICSFYFLMILCICFLDKEKKAFKKMATWYLLWYLIKSMELTSGIIFDVTTILYMERIVDTKIINENLTFFSLLSNAFCVEEDIKEKEKEKGIISNAIKERNPCQIFKEKGELCASLMDGSFFKDTMARSVPFGEIAADIEGRYKVGDCVIRNKISYDDCMIDFNKKKK